MKKKICGFTLIELLVVIAIIGILAAMIFVAQHSVIVKARDVKRKAEISQIGGLLTGLGCYLPDGGGGTYDLVPLMEELRIKYPEYSRELSVIPKDPKAGTESEAFYRYIVTNDGSKCVLYANLENANEKVTLTEITAPTAGGGTGVLQTVNDGWNNTPKYFQVSN